ncbi:MAG: hypothetical protein HQ492_03960 [Woeseiaceae bacterium]|nr:hypothetical protein [Woeseiaceae bacterium]
MAERIKDAEDRLLESMFASPPLADNGFSVRVVRTLNRRLWLRRLTLPTAAIIGGAIAFKPLAGLFAALSSLSSLIPADTISMATGSIPQFQTVVLGAILLVVGLVSARMLEE